MHLHSNLEALLDLNQPIAGELTLFSKTENPNKIGKMFIAYQSNPTQDQNNLPSSHQSEVYSFSDQQNQDLIQGIALGTNENSSPLYSSNSSQSPKFLVQVVDYKNKNDLISFNKQNQIFEAIKDQEVVLKRKGSNNFQTATSFTDSEGNLYEYPEGCVYQVYQYEELRKLTEVINNINFQDVQNFEVHFAIFQQILDFFTSLHQSKVRLVNLTLDSFYINKENQIFLTNVSQMTLTSKEKIKANFDKETYTNKQYLAPEELIRNKPNLVLNEEGIDVYHLGVMLFQFIFKRFPPKNMEKYNEQEQQQNKMILTLLRNFYKTEKIPTEQHLQFYCLSQLTGMMLHKDSEERPSFKYIKEALDYILARREPQEQ